MRAGRSRLLALGGLAVGALLALVAASRPWWRAAGAQTSVSFTGTASTGGLAQALALVVLVGALLALVLRARGRQVLGVLLLLTGAGALVAGLLRPRPSSGTVRSRVAEVSLADQFALVGSPWPYVYATAGLVVVAAAVLMVTTALRWPARTARFDRTAPVAAAGSSARPDSESDPATLWRSLDAGLDPTEDRSSERVDVREHSVGVTMNERSDVRTVTDDEQPAT